MNESGGNISRQFIGLKLPVVKARVPNQKRHNGKALSHRKMCPQGTKKQVEIT